MIARTRAEASDPSSPRPSTNDLSIFSTSIGRWRRCPSEEEPVLKEVRRGSRAWLRADLAMDYRFGAPKALDILDG